ncbi:integrase family protein [Paracoccus cavernae]|uniref:Integrase family protein n=3 Tax=Paracoccus cavernae TaxID=1571207 RepID=A0ABT8D931_9RHOB|nr:integrase family protein [Paracoccus cavernae]
MPKRAKELSAIEVKRLAEGVHPVGGVAGLYLQVVGQGKSWLLRATVGAKRREIGLGAYPEVTLANAREKAAHTREMIRQGVDPVEQRKALRAELVAAQKRGLLFADAVDLFAPIKAKKLSAGKYREQWRDSLDKYAVPELGKMLVGDISRDDLLRVLRPLWDAKTVTADKLRRKIHEVLEHAAANGHRSGDNPARWEGNLKSEFSEVSAATENYPALQLKDLPRWWEALSRRDGMGAAALRFQTMTATRAGAVRYMSWSEVDLPGRVWTVQPGRQSSKISRRDGPRRVP